MPSSRTVSRKNRLLDLEVFEVSLVKKPANGRSFYLTKQDADKDQKMNDEQLLALLENPSEIDEKLNALIEKAELSEGAVRAIRSAMRLLDAFKDEIPSDTLAGLAEAAGMDARMEEEKGYRRMKEDEEEKEATAEKSAEALLKSEDLPESVKETLQALWKSHNEASERVGQLESVLKAERDKRLLDLETERVSKEFGHVPGVENGSLASALIELRKNAPEQVDLLEGILKSTEAALVAKDNGAFEETGTTVAKSAPENAWGEIQQRAEVLVTKGDQPNRAKAIDQVLRDNPELYATYISEKGGQ